MLLVDTDVLVDVLRRHPPSLEWLQNLGDEVIGVPGLVAMELLNGCRNRDEQRRAESTLRLFVLYWPNAADCAKAFDDFSQYHLSHQIGLLDSLIAATAVGLNVPLATFNQKHYAVVAGLQIIQPYTR
ncbi:MAG: type II toxin-antitoxin system VapC family toxin [Chloroflexi bacterium]|nr:type II toxin-antitoxin system VapC family toxin [Chloroflexota bacterium]